MTTTITTPARVHADHAATKRLGNWTDSSQFEVRTRRGSVVLDLRSPDITGDIEVRLDIDHGTVKLLVPEGAVVEHWDLEWIGRGKIKDWTATPTGEPRRIRLLGRVQSGEVRVHRGGVAMLSAMFSREYLEDCRRAHRTGTTPTVDDPTRTF